VGARAKRSQGGLLRLPVGGNIFEGTRSLFKARSCPEYLKFTKVGLDTFSI